MTNNETIPLVEQQHWSETRKTAWSSHDGPGPKQSVPRITTTEHEASPSHAKRAWYNRKRWKWALSALLLSVALLIGLTVHFLGRNAGNSGDQDIILPQILSSADFNGQIFLLAKGDDSRVWYTTRVNGTWTHKWNSTGPQGQCQPSSVVWGTPKRLSVFHTRDDNMVMTSSLQNGLWADWEVLGAQASSPVVPCLEMRNDVIHIWARERTNAKFIMHNYWQSSQDDWLTQSSSWEGGINSETAKGSRSMPAVVCRNSSTSNDVVIYDKEFGLGLHRQWNTTRNRWGAWGDLGGPYAGDPVLVSPSNDRVDFFGIEKTGRALVHRFWNESSGYSNPYDLGGAWASIPSVAVTGSSRLDVFALSVNGTVQHRALIGSTWSPDWSDLGVSATSAPLATLLKAQSPQIMLQVLGSEGDVLSSDWEVTDAGGLNCIVPLESIGGNLSSSTMTVT
ncbi:hypothetical protein BKA67DRAFT_650005 [Truncatella angustata]|uniref:PLL-like beta propeller domain-containing protein n=1 Tax=Truncatella angustata TaxID=152316 RepID=A0A9P8RP63_9PEZI|nr:uncharacterized protein BKA67DRAFT_650005 [Truncatella angustata]KAH6646766.1 hypothetical protein BKA67DRAFT_650005 [Truncatella angustata]